MGILHHDKIIMLLFSFCELILLDSQQQYESFSSFSLFLTIHDSGMICHWDLSGDLPVTATNCQPSGVLNSFQRTGVSISQCFYTLTSFCRFPAHPGSILLTLKPDKLFSVFCGYLKFLIPNSMYFFSFLSFSN